MFQNQWIFMLRDGFGATSRITSIWSKLIMIFYAVALSSALSPSQWMIALEMKMFFPLYNHYQCSDPKKYKQYSLMSMSRPMHPKNTKQTKKNMNCKHDIVLGGRGHRKLTSWLGILLIREAGGVPVSRIICCSWFISMTARSRAYSRHVLQITCFCLSPI